MVTRWLALAQRYFPERQFLLRSGDKVRYLSLPGWVQATALVSGLAVFAGVGGLAGAYHNLHKAIHRKEAAISEVSNRAAALASLQTAIASTDEQYARMSEQFDEVTQQLDAAAASNETLRTAIAAAEARVAALDRTRLALERRLHGAEQTLASKSGNLTQLSKQLADSRTELRDAEKARAGLQTKLTQLLADSDTASNRTGKLKESLAIREQALKQIATERDRLRTQFDQQSEVAKDAPRGYGSQLEQLIASTGVDLGRILGSAPAGQGGPYVALDPHRATLPQEREREAALHNLAQSLPLAAPLDHYQVESPFGQRVDPINHHSSFHSGLDLSRPLSLARVEHGARRRHLHRRQGRLWPCRRDHPRARHRHALRPSPPHPGRAGQKVRAHQDGRPSSAAPAAAPARTSITRCWSTGSSSIPRNSWKPARASRRSAPRTDASAARQRGGEGLSRVDIAAGQHYRDGAPGASSRPASTAASAAAPLGSATSFIRRNAPPSRARPPRR